MEQPVNDFMECPIRKAAAADPDRIALVEANRTVTYGDLNCMVERVAERLRQRGVSSGDVVAILDDNSLFYALLFHAAFRAGFILMPMNTRLTEADWRRQINEANCRLIIAGDKFIRRLPAAGIDTVTLEEITSDNHEYPIPAHPIRLDPTGEALIIFSSGSRGASRGVVLTRRNLYYSAIGVASFLKYQKDDRWLAVLPFFHVGGISILFRAALAGSGVHIMTRFESHDLLSLLKQKSIQYLSVVPTMLHELMRIDDEAALRNLKAIIVGGAPFDDSLKHEAERRKLPVLTTYGMTETSSMVTLLPLHQPPDKLATAGRLLPHRQLIIADDDGRCLPPEIKGRILVRGEVLFSRYLNDPHPPMQADEWFDTGDFGALDRDGFLIVGGRTDRIIISGGENIDLNLIETALTAIKGVDGAVALGRKDSKWGERPVAFVQISDENLSEVKINDDLRRVLAPMMVPDRIIIIARLPLTGSGKYDRQELKKHYGDFLDGKAGHSPC